MVVRNTLKFAEPTGEFITETEESGCHRQSQSTGSACMQGLETEAKTLNENKLLKL